MDEGRYSYNLVSLLCSEIVNCQSCTYVHFFQRILEFIVRFLKLHKFKKKNLIITRSLYKEDISCILR